MATVWESSIVYAECFINAGPIWNRHFLLIDLDDPDDFFLIILNDFNKV